MIYKFKSKAAGDVIMMGPTGDLVLRVIGKEPAPKGILLPEAMPAALAALERAIADEDTRREQARREAEAQGRTPAPEEGVSLRQRAWPLAEMIRRAQAAEQEIVWGV